MLAETGPRIARSGAALHVYGCNVAQLLTRTQRVTIPATRAAGLHFDGRQHTVSVPSSSGISSVKFPFLSRLEKSSSAIFRDPRFAAIIRGV